MTRLCELEPSNKITGLKRQENHAVKICNTDVRFSIKGYTLAVGTADGLVQLWDARTSQLIKSMKTHQGRVGKRERRVVYRKSHIQTADMYTALGCLAWNESVITSGSNDRFIAHSDKRSPADCFRILPGHCSEVCSAKNSVCFLETA